MANRPFGFLINPFLVATENNYKKMTDLSTFTYNALGTVPSLAAVKTFLHASYVDYLAKYDTWKNNAGERKTSTLSLGVLIDDLPRQAKDWDFEIQHFAREGTAEYKTYFPNGRTPYSRGTQEEKIRTVKQLLDELAKRTPVPPIKDTVNDYYTDLNAAFVGRQGKGSTVTQSSDAVELARVAVGVALYSVMGQLMAIYPENPTQIEAFIDTEALRRKPQDEFTGHTGPQEHETIVKRAMEEDEQVTLKNTGLVPLTFYWANVKGGPIPTGVTGVTLQPSEHTHVPASALGNPAEDKFLSVFNPSEIAEGEWDVEL
jgi:hypothetical protein